MRRHDKSEATEEKRRNDAGKQREKLGIGAQATKIDAGSGRYGCVNGTRRGSKRKSSGATCIRGDIGRTVEGHIGRRLVLFAGQVGGKIENVTRINRL